METEIPRASVGVRVRVVARVGVEGKGQMFKVCKLPAIR